MPPTSISSSHTVHTDAPLYLDVRPCTSIPYLVLSTTTAAASSAAKPQRKDVGAGAPFICETDEDVSQVLDTLISDVDGDFHEIHNIDGSYRCLTSVFVDRSVVVSNRRVKLRIIPKLSPTSTTSPKTTQYLMVAITVRSSAPSQWTIKQSSVVIPMGSSHEVVVSLRKTLRKYELRSNLLITARVVRDTEGISPEESLRRGSTWKSQNVELDPKGPQVENKANINATSSTDINTLDTGLSMLSPPSDVIHTVVPCVISMISATPILYDRLLLQYHKHQRNAPLHHADDEGGSRIGETLDTDTNPAVEMNLSNLLLGGESEDSPSPERSPQSGTTAMPRSRKVNLMNLVDRFVAVSKAAEKARHRTIVPTVAGNRPSALHTKGKSVVVTAASTIQSNPRSLVADVDASTAPVTTTPAETTTSTPDISSSDLDTLVVTLEERLLHINTMVDAANKEIHDILHHNQVGGMKTAKPRTPTTMSTSKAGKVLGCIRVLFGPPVSVWGWASQYNWAPMGLTLISLMLTWLIGITVASGRY